MNGKRCLADIALAQAAYANYCEMWRAVGALAPSGSVFDVEQRADMLLIRSNYARRVPHMILDPVVDHAAVHDWVSTLVRDLAADPVSLVVGIPPGQEHSSMVAALKAEGFQPAVRPKVAMACQGLPLAGDEDLDGIEVAQSEPALQEARELLAGVFGLPSDVFAFYTPPSLVTTYLLRLDGTAIAAMCLCPFAGCAGIYSVAVIPSARGRGYARRLVRAALRDAAARGLDTAVLSCERSLVGLYQALGFAVCWELAEYWLEAWWR